MADDVADRIVATQPEIQRLMKRHGTQRHFLAELEEQTQAHKSQELERLAAEATEIDTQKLQAAKRLEELNQRQKDLAAQKIVILAGEDARTQELRGQVAKTEGHISTINKLLEV